MLQKGNNKTARKSRARVSNAVDLDARNPIPFGNDEVFSFVHNVSYLPFLPPKDDFAQMLLEARLLSVTHDSCVRTKKDYIAGEGFSDKNGKELTEEQNNWLKALNVKNHTAVKVNRLIEEYFLTFGNCPIEVVRFTVSGKKYLFVYPQNFMEWRLCKPNSDGIIEFAVQSKLFLKNRSYYLTGDVIKDAKKLPIYRKGRSDKANWVRDEMGTERTLIWYSNEVAGVPHYGLPSAVSSMIYQVLEYKGARYNLDNFDNNMVAAAILALKGNLSADEANKIGRQIIKQHTGDGKRGRTVVVASEEGIEGSDFHKLDTKTDGSFNESDTRWSEKIILANQWDAVLAGLLSPSTLGKGSGFLTKIIETKFKSVIKPAQNELVDQVWSLIFEMADNWLGLRFSDYELEIKNSIDISGLTDVDITPAVQVNEVRESKGLPNDPKMEGVYMKQPGTKTKTEEQDV